MKLLLLLLAGAATAPCAEAGGPLQLDVADDGKQARLVVRHPAIGPACELWCYEGGPFHYGASSRTARGEVVFVHKSRGMTATSTFTPAGPERVLMDVVVEGPLAQLKTVSLVGPCMQFWHAPAFQRRGSLAEFASRCFIYTARGPAGMLDTARGRMSAYPPGAPENQPPYTQWYVPVGFPHPGNIWGFGASGDRPLYGVVGVTSADGKWLSAIGCAQARTVGQGWHDCIHHVPHMQAYLDEKAARIVHRTVLYVMPNDTGRLLDSFRRDFPAAEPDRVLRVSAGRDGTLDVRPRRPGAPSVRLSLTPLRASRHEATGRWQPLPWGGLERQGPGWRMWATPAGDTVDLAVTVEGAAAGPVADAALAGQGWTAGDTGAFPALLQSAAGGWHAAVLWEKSPAGQPGRALAAAGGESGDATSVRGRLYIAKDAPAALHKRWAGDVEDWQHAVPYRMPLLKPAPAPAAGEVRFAPNAEGTLTYGLTIVPPWPAGGAAHVNFPEHLEYEMNGRGIARHSDKRANPWKIAGDGRSAAYEVESLEVPGVKVEASATSRGDRALLWFKITNRSGKTLARVKPLLCFWYAKLAGFPQRLTDNFQHTWVMLDGKPVTLAAIPTARPDATAKVAYVRGCTQHDCDQFAQSRGGLIDRDIDMALTAVTARDGARKAVLAFTPGKSILSNAAIPCMHADPFLGGDLEDGKSVEANGVLLFTEGPLEDAVAGLRRALAVR